MNDVDVIKAFEKILVGADDTFASFFMEVSPIKSVDSANKTNFSCHMIRRDVNGHDRVQAIARMLAEKVIDYAIPSARIRVAYDD